MCIEGIILSDLIGAPRDSPGEAYERNSTEKKSKLTVALVVPFFD